MNSLFYSVVLWFIHNLHVLCLILLFLCLQMIFQVPVCYSQSDNATPVGLGANYACIEAINIPYLLTNVTSLFLNGWQEGTSVGDISSQVTACSRKNYFNAVLGYRFLAVCNCHAPALLITNDYNVSIVRAVLVKQCVSPHSRQFSFLNSPCIRSNLRFADYCIDSVYDKHTVVKAVWNTCSLSPMACCTLFGFVMERWCRETSKRYLIH